MTTDKELLKLHISTCNFTLIIQFPILLSRNHIYKSFIKAGSETKF